jgi:hypothetical protein
LNSEVELRKVPCPANVQQTTVVNPVVSHNVFQHMGSNTSEEWLVDSGATVHLVNDFGLLHNAVVYAEPRQLRLASAEGQGSIVGSGSVY